MPSPAALPPNLGELASFGSRLLADVIDSVITLVILAILFWTTPVIDYPLALVLTALYGAVTEGSAAQASFGKRALGLRVTTVTGQRASYLRIFFRWLLKEFAFGFVIGWIVFLFIFWNPKKQGLHDIIFGTLVWKTR